MAENAPLTLSYKKLPPEARNKLKAMLRRGEEWFVFPQKFPIHYWAGFIISLIWFGFLIFSTQDVLWEDWMFWLLAGLTAVIVPIFIFCLFKIVFYFASPVKNNYIFSSDEFLKTSGDKIEVWNLKHLLSARFREEHKNIEVWIDNRQEVISLSNDIDAQKLEESFDSLKENASSDGFFANYSKPDFAYNKNTNLINVLLWIAFSIVLAAGISYGARGLNFISDDHLSYKKASLYNTIKDYDEYKVKHPEGRHILETNQKVEEIFNKLKNEYTSEIKKNADSSAVAAFTKILDDAAKGSNKTIYVKLNETLNLDEKVVDKMKRVSGVSINSYFSALPPTKMEIRKKMLLGNLKQVFTRFTKEGLLMLEPNENPPEKAPFINIDYLIESDETVFTTQVAGGSSQLSYYPGAKFTYNFNLKTDDASKSFQTVFVDVPKSFSSGVFDLRDSANYEFNEVFVGTSCTAFEKYLEQKFGLTE